MASKTRDFNADALFESVCVCVGWGAAALTSRWLEQRSKKQVARAKASSLADVADEPAPTEFDFELDAQLQAFEAHAGEKDAARQLFESYGLLGSAPGAWTSDPAVDELDFQLDATGRDSARQLFETYGLLGATPGAWTSDSSDELDRPSRKLTQADAPSARELFESYGLFGSVPGAWS